MPHRAAHRGLEGGFFVVEPDRAGLDELARLVADGRLDPRVDRVVPPAEAARAYEALEGGHRRGKFVLREARRVSRARGVVRVRFLERRRSWTRVS